AQYYPAHGAATRERTAKNNSTLRAAHLTENKAGKQNNTARGAAQAARCTRPTQFCRKREIKRKGIK
ncbi:hypothetical protein A2U01_0099013, partial [Trifolium medium]|nr:hypothetical protein [Trifolium medium]